jgi:peptidoglycan/LPS O-acetylase OafA/YrhL
MYNVHLLAFPLGMLLASLIAFPNKIAVTLQNIISVFQNRFKQKINSEKFFYYLKNIIYYLLIAVLALVIWYTAINSGVGSTPIKEELISLVTVFAFTLLFIIKRIEFKLLSLFGLYSYEIYLLHWPLMYRYDFVFKYLPPWLAMLVYLALFVGLSWGLKKLIDVLANLKFGQTKKLSQ